MQCFAIKTVGDYRLEGGVEPAAEIVRTLVINELGCIFGDKRLLVIFGWKPGILIVVVLLENDELALFKRLLLNEFRSLHSEHLEKVGDLFTVRCPSIYINQCSTLTSEFG